MWKNNSQNSESGGVDDRFLKSTVMEEAISDMGKEEVLVEQVIDPSLVEIRSTSSQPLPLWRGREETPFKDTDQGVMSFLSPEKEKDIPLIECCECELEHISSPLPMEEQRVSLFQPPCTTCFSQEDNTVEGINTNWRKLGTSIQVEPTIPSPPSLPIKIPITQITSIGNTFFPVQSPFLMLVDCCEGTGINIKKRKPIINQKYGQDVVSEIILQITPPDKGVQDDVSVDIEIIDYKASAMFDKKFMRQPVSIRKQNVVYPHEFQCPGKDFELSRTIIDMKPDDATSLAKEVRKKLAKESRPHALEAIKEVEIKVTYTIRLLVCKQERETHQIERTIKAKVEWAEGKRTFVLPGKALEEITGKTGARTCCGDKSQFHWYLETIDTPKPVGAGRAYKLNTGVQVRPVAYGNGNNVRVTVMVYQRLVEAEFDDKKVVLNFYQRQNLGTIDCVCNSQQVTSPQWDVHDIQGNEWAEILSAINREQRMQKNLGVEVRIKITTYISLGLRCNGTGKQEHGGTKSYERLLKAKTALDNNNRFYLKEVQVPL